jgi:hypothetical protein
LTPLASGMRTTLVVTSNSSTSPDTIQITGSTPVPTFGSVRGGQTAVSGATIQLYAVGTTGDGSPSTPLLNPAVVADSNGNFNLGTYQCPGANAPVYVAASGEVPG